MIQLIDLCPTIQTKVNFNEVAAAGFHGAYIKSSQYSGTRIWKHKDYADRAEAAGLAPGAYHFAYVGSDPLLQAKFFFDACYGLGSKDGELPPMLDLEFAQPDVSGKHIVEWGEACLEEMVKLWYPDNRLLDPTDHRYRLPGIYMYPYFIQRCMPYIGRSKLLQFPLHIASYKSRYDAATKKHVLVPWEPDLSKDKPLIPNGTWHSWKLWQYSGNNGKKVPGIPMDCDRNVFNGDEEDWKDFLGQRMMPRNVASLTGSTQTVLKR